jgi:hypothetical protein
MPLTFVNLGVPFVIHFVVVAGTPEAVTRVSPRLMTAMEQTRYFDGEACAATSANRTWAVAAIMVPDPLCGTRLAFDEDAMVVINGPAVAHGVRPAEFSVELLARFKARGSVGVATGLGGNFNFVGVAPDIGLRAFVDFSGFCPLYWHGAPDFAVFSNRASTIAKVIHSTGWDLRALAWLISHANLRGEQMPARGVSYLLPGIEAQMRPGGGELRMERSPSWVWPPRSEDRGRDNLTSEEWDAVTADLMANFRALGSLGHRMRLLLSGGKDSRLCLALAKAAGLQDRIVAVTNGPPDGPEVECATEVARVAGVSHVRLGGDYATAPDVKPRTASRSTLRAMLQRRTRKNTPELDASLIWRRLRQHAYRYDAIVSPWDGVNDRLQHATLNIRGVGGELYRRGSDKRVRQMDLTSVEQMVSTVAEGADPLGVLRQDEQLLQHDWLCEWARGAAEQMRIDALPERWYVDYRLGHWNGPLSQAKPGYIIVTPIVSASAARRNMGLSPEVRSSDRLHFEVMRRAAPELVNVPFVNDTWSPRIAANAAVDLPDKPYPTKTKATARVLASWQYLFLEKQRREIEQLFDEAARNTDMPSICDLDKLKTRLRTVTSIKRGPLQMFTCIGVAIALLGRAERVVDHCPALTALEE